MSHKKCKYPDKIIAFSQLLGSRGSQQDFAGHRVLELPNNETACYLSLADGMGGKPYGDIAATLAIGAFLNLPSEKNIVGRNFLLSGLERANKALESSIRHNPEYCGMGTSFLAVTVIAGTVSWISVGDSPLYLYQGDTLRRLNQDHSMLPELSKMVENGQLSELELASDPRRWVLRSYLNGNTPPLVDIQVNTISLEAYDVLLLTSDGINTLSHKSLQSILDRNNKLSTRGLTEKILRKIADCGISNQDNTSVMVYRHT